MQATIKDIKTIDETTRYRNGNPIIDTELEAGRHSERVWMTKRLNDDERVFLASRGQTVAFRFHLHS